MIQRVSYEYREDGILAAPASIELASSDSTYGIKAYDGTVIVADSSATVESDSTGIYYYLFNAEPNTIYYVSWKITPSDSDPYYVVQQAGPYEDPTQNIRATTDIRGFFRQGQVGSAFLRIFDFEGQPKDAESISIDIVDSVGDSALFGTPYKVENGFYAFDWAVSDSQIAGEYFAIWTYVVDGNEHTESQKLIVSAAGDSSTLYSGRVNEMRQSLTVMITQAQSIPVYREPAKKSRDNKTYEFTFPRWNSVAGVRVYRNGNLVNSGYTINHFRGTITFDSALTTYDRVEAGYNFRWFDDQALDRFISNATHLLNIWPPATRMSINSSDEKWIVVILYGAAVDALRNMMLSLQFQEPQLVFGGAERADKVFSNLETIKKNYEETWNKALEQKKFGPYKGLTRMLVTPEFAIPSSRARWFRYIFSGGV